ncbi:hypothetical protein [Pseudorhodoplanes sinuspersici]|nr:hypothetical protein [Pseudorhodoplanes sinuspersici]
MTSASLYLISALGACSGDPTLTRYKSGEWIIEGKIDRVSDKPSYQASVLTRSRSYKAEPFQLELADLQLLCFDNAPVVYFKFLTKVGSNRNSRLSYRFDQNPGHNVNVRILRDSKTIVIEDQDEVVRFVDEMRTASNLIVQVFSLTEFLSTADFKVEGAQKAIDAVYAGCPPRPVQRPKVS